MTESPPGTYTASVPPPGWPHGFVHVTFTAAAGVPNPPCGPIDGGYVYIDPSGVVQTTGGVPIAGATVTLFRSDTGETGTFVQVPNGSAIMSPGNRTNPDATDSAGHFGWDVIAGFYFVRAAKAGCGSADTAILHILDVPVTNLVIQLNCSGTGGLVGDYNTDRTVDIRDYGVWRANFGAQPLAIRQTATLTAEWTSWITAYGARTSASRAMPRHGPRRAPSRHRYPHPARPRRRAHDECPDHEALMRAR